jgi:hypothetical protein
LSLRSCLHPVPQYGHSLALPVQASALAPDTRPPLGVCSYHAPQWSGVWTQAGRTWSTVTEINAQ